MMLGAIEKLKEIGLKEIAYNTHISLNKLESIAKKDFSKLTDKTTTYGLLKILEREYKVDFTEWFQEYEVFMEELKKEEHAEHRDSYEKLEDMRDNSRGKFYFVLILFAAAILFVFYFYKNPVADIISAGSERFLKTESVSPSAEKTEKQDALENALEESQKEKELNVVVYDDNTTAQSEVESESPTVQQTSESTSSVSSIEMATQSEKIVAIEPKSRVWVGVVYLDNYIKKDFFVNTRFDVNTSKSQLLYLGHGQVSIIDGDRTFTPDKQTAVRFYYDKDSETITEIDADKFKELNRGKDW